MKSYSVFAKLWSILSCLTEKKFQNSSTGTTLLFEILCDKNVNFLCFARSTSLRSAGRCIKGTTGPWGGRTIASWPSTTTWCSYFETSVMVKIRSSNLSDICPFAYEDDGLRSSFLMNLLFPPLITPECNKWQIKLQILYLSMFSFVTE